MNKNNHSCCKKSEHTHGKDNIVLAAIAGLTIVVVAGIWFASANRTQPESNLSASSQSPQQQASESMDGHHTQSQSPASSAALDAMVGKPVPDFSFTDMKGIVYSKEGLKGKNVILFFNEGLMCYPACWEQIVQLSPGSFSNASDTIALSIVVDDRNDWQQAIDQMPALANATVVFDTNKDVSEKFNVLTTPSSMHYGQLPGHSYVVVDKEGIVRHTYDDPSMALHNDQLKQVVEKL